MCLIRMYSIEGYLFLPAECMCAPALWGWGHLWSVQSLSYSCQPMTRNKDQFYYHQTFTYCWIKSQNICNIIFGIWRPPWYLNLVSQSGIYYDSAPPTYPPIWKIMLRRSTYMRMMKSRRTHLHNCQIMQAASAQWNHGGTLCRNDGFSWW